MAYDPVQERYDELRELEPKQQSSDKRCAHGVRYPHECRECIWEGTPYVAPDPWELLREIIDAARSPGHLQWTRLGTGLQAANEALKQHDAGY